MDLPIDQILGLVSGENFGGVVNSILLALILLNIRSLKAAILKIEDGHDKRISKLEVQFEQLRGVTK